MAISRIRLNPLHKYLYADGNPINGWDPSGRASVIETGGTTAIQTSLSSMEGQSFMSFYNQVGNIISGMSAEQAMISVLCEAGIQTLSLVGLGMVSRFAEGLMDGSFAARWGNWGSLEEDLAQAGIQGTSAANRVIYKEYATELRLEVISQRLEKSAVTKGMELNPAEYQVFRGGPGFAVGPNDTVIDRVTGLIKPTKGISLHIDPSTLERFGGGYQINGLSSELKIIQRGNDLGHFEIVPRAPMSPERYQELLEQVKIRY